MKNYYKLLGVSSDASSTDIKKAFRTLAKKYHPDKNVNDESAILKFQEINEAYRVLGDEKSREEYDKKILDLKETNKKKSSNSKNNINKSNSNGKGESLNNLDKYFESFFGFNANTNNINKEKLKNKNSNPIDTTNIFNNFFKAHSKK